MITNILFEKDHIPNIKAIINGRQIILCKKKPSEYSDSDVVFLLSNTNTGSMSRNQADSDSSNFLLSEKGIELLREFGKDRVSRSNTIIRTEDIQL